eukprot:scaffold4318_cov300-Prasinococcus_capsulatus_cf.AAC.3
MGAGPGAGSGAGAGPGSGVIGGRTSSSVFRPRERQGKRNLPICSSSTANTYNLPVSRASGVAAFKQWPSTRRANGCFLLRLFHAMGNAMAGVATS